MIKSLSALFAIVIIVGCASSKPPVNVRGKANYNTDYNECRYEAELNTPYGRSGMEYGYNVGKLTNRCMYIRGWR